MFVCIQCLISAPNYPLLARRYRLVKLSANTFVNRANIIIIYCLESFENGIIQLFFNDVECRQKIISVKRINIIIIIFLKILFFQTKQGTIYNVEMTYCLFHGGSMWKLQKHHILFMAFFRGPNLFNNKQNSDSRSHSRSPAARGAYPFAPPNFVLLPGISPDIDEDTDRPSLGKRIEGENVRGAGRVKPLVYSHV